jgi:serine/threonine protein phosphatase PrpC
MDTEPSVLHEMEDRHLVENSQPNSVVFCVFDGHDGPNAVNFVTEKLTHILRSKSWRNLVSKTASTAAVRESEKERIVTALKEFFTVIDKEYFDTRRHFITERQRLQGMFEVWQFMSASA